MHGLQMCQNLHQIPLWSHRGILPVQKRLKPLVLWNNTNVMKHSPDIANHNLRVFPPPNSYIQRPIDLSTWTFDHNVVETNTM